MRPVTILCVFLLAASVSTATSAQPMPDPQKIRAGAELRARFEGAFPYVETQFASLKWKQGKGGSFVSHVIKDHEYEFQCDYSCSLVMELSADAFRYDRTEPGDNPPYSVHHVYVAEGIARVIQHGVLWHPFGCGETDEYETPLFLEVLEFENEELADPLFTHGWINWDLGDCFGQPAEADVTP